MNDGTFDRKASITDALWNWISAAKRLFTHLGQHNLALETYSIFTAVFNLRSYASLVPCLRSASEASKLSSAKRPLTP